MAASKGRSFVLQIGDGATSESFNTIGGLIANTVTINNENVDMTNKDSAGWRELLEGAGTRSVSISGNGIFKDDTYGKAARTACLAGTHKNYKIIDSDTGDYFTGEFAPTTFEQSGDQNTPMNFSLTLESSGAVTFTEATGG